MIYVYIELALFGLLLLFAPLMLWADYVAVMNIKRVRNIGRAGGAYTLSKPALMLGSHVLIRGYLLDAFVNLIHASIILREWPRELTVTRRLRRHIEGNTSRAALCLAIRTQLLDGFDPDGIHS